MPPRNPKELEDGRPKIPPCLLILLFAVCAEGSRLGGSRVDSQTMSLASVSTSSANQPLVTSFIARGTHPGNAR